MKGLLLIVISVLLCGCATHTKEIRSVSALLEVGNTAAAEKEVGEIAKSKSDSGDSLVWLLEEGAIARANGNINKSIESFNSAYEKIEYFENQPETAILAETKAVLTNQSYLPYKGYNYDKIMMCAYQAMNFMELKKFDKAAVWLKRLEFFQDNAERLNRERIEGEADALVKAKRENKEYNYDVEKTTSNAQVSSAFHRIYGDDFSMSSANGTKSLIMNPFAYWLSGVFFLNRAADVSDIGKSSDMFRLGGNLSSARIFSEDYISAEQKAQGGIQKNITYVIYETGMAPIKRQIRIDLPLYIFAGRNFPHIGMNFPYLNMRGNYAENISIVAGNKVQQTETIVDMDNVISDEFKTTLPLVITKTVISAAVKASAQYAAAAAAGDGWGGVLVNIAGSIYQIAMNDADLSTWTSLPKKIKVARFETPADGKVFIEGKAISVELGGTNVILAKRMASSGTIILRKFDFKN